jgi:ABC-type uncharacterized transport system substrate-binding protein
MTRREFITLLGGTAATWPLAARAQQTVMPVIGYLANASPAGFANFIAAFRRGLEETGYREDRNVAIEYRWAEGHQERLPDLVADLIGRRVAVIVATGGQLPAQTARAATATIPIVFTGGGDPVKAGLVASLNRPGGNATGVINIEIELTAKRLALLRELVPNAALIAVLFNPTSPAVEEQVREIEQAARKIGQNIHVFNANNETEFDAAFAGAVERQAGALFVSGDPLFTSHRATRGACRATPKPPRAIRFAISSWSVG